MTQEMPEKKLSRVININLSVTMPEGFMIRLYDSIKKGDKEPFCCGLTRELGNKYSHHSGFSAVSFEDAFLNCCKAFDEKSARYWNEIHCLPALNTLLTQITKEPK